MRWFSSENLTVLGRKHLAAQLKCHKNNIQITVSQSKDLCSNIPSLFISFLFSHYCTSPCGLFTLTLLLQYHF